jgi:hypothetical protein
MTKAAAAPPNSVMKSRRLMPPPSITTGHRIGLSIRQSSAAGPPGSTGSHSGGFFALVAVAPILRPSHPLRHFPGCLFGLPLRTTGSLASVFGLLGVGWLFCRRFRCHRRRSSCRSGRGLCSVGSAFRNVVFFGDLGRLVCGFVGSPFFLAGLHCLLLRKRRRCRKCEASKNKSKATEEY